MHIFKVCLLGAFAVGKTSLVRRFVSDVFSERYLTTLGVKIEKRDLSVDGHAARLVVWDIHGEDRFQHVDPLYLRGAAGVLLTLDPTRPETVPVGAELSERARSVAPNAVQFAALNKQDLQDQWTAEAVTAAEELPAERCFRVSAKTGAGVEITFEALTRRLLGLSG